MSVRLSTSPTVVLEVAEAVVAAIPRAAVVLAGIGLLKASKKAGVPKVSVRAMANTYHTVSETCDLETCPIDLLLHQRSQANTSTPAHSQSHNYR